MKNNLKLWIESRFENRMHKEMMKELGTSSEVASKASPNIRYSTMLICEAIKKHQSSIEISKNQPLPLIEGMSNLVAEVGLTSLVNRLKVMCALNPVTFMEPKTGTCTVIMQESEYTVACHFDDQSDIVCTIGITKTSDSN